MIGLSYNRKENMSTERTEERKNRFNGESVMLTKEATYMIEYLSMSIRATLG